MQFAIIRTDNVLSEIAAPKPVERHAGAEVAQRGPLEQRLSSVSH